jgi:hypothetical protein
VTVHDNGRMLRTMYVYGGRLGGRGSRTTPVMTLWLAGSGPSTVVRLLNRARWRSSRIGRLLRRRVIRKVQISYRGETSCA